MKSEYRDPTRDGFAIGALVLGVPIVLLGLWVGSNAIMMSSSPQPEMYFGLGGMAWIATALCMLVGAPPVFLGLRHFTRDVPPKADG